MEKKFAIPRPDRESMVKHRQQVMRQIYLPMIGISLLIIALMVLATYATFGWGGDVERWAAVSTIWLVIPNMLGALIFLALLFASIYGMRKLLLRTPRYTGIAQDYALWFLVEVKLWTDKLIRPVIALRAWIEFFTPKTAEEEKKEA